MISISFGKSSSSVNVSVSNHVPHKSLKFSTSACALSTLSIYTFSSSVNSSRAVERYVILASSVFVVSSDGSRQTSNVQPFRLKNCLCKSHNQALLA
jgi:hypothetical protein